MSARMREGGAKGSDCTRSIHRRKGSGGPTGGDTATEGRESDTGIQAWDLMDMP